MVMTWWLYDFSACCSRHRFQRHVVGDLLGSCGSGGLGRPVDGYPMFKPRIWRNSGANGVRDDVVERKVLTFSNSISATFTASSRWES